MIWEVFPELSKNLIGEPATITPPSSSTISHTNISSSAHHTLSSISYTTNSHTHSYITDHLHHSNTTAPTTISITTLTSTISPKQSCHKKRKKTCFHHIHSLHHNDFNHHVHQRVRTYLLAKETTFEKDKTIHPDDHPKEKPTYTQSFHFHQFQAKLTQKISPPIHTPQD